MGSGSSTSSYKADGGEGSIASALVGPTAQELALKDLFDCTGGAAWKNKKGWTDQRDLDDRGEVGHYFGVAVNKDGFVLRIELPRNLLQGVLPKLDAVSECVSLILSYDHATPDPSSSSTV